MKLAFLLLGLAAATDDVAPETTGYEGEETYAPTTVATYTPHVSTCFNGCVGCFNKHTGQCIAKSCGYHTEAYEPETGYRRLAESENEYGYEAPETETLQPSYEPMYEPPHSCGCPSGFKDTSDFFLHHNTVLWVAFGLLFAPAFCFLWRGILREDPLTIFDPKSATLKKLLEQWEEVSMVRICAGVVCAIASLAYLTMALGHGYLTKCDGRSFYYARYVDWMLTTPLMLWDLCTLGCADSRTRLFILVMDVLMIGSGLIGGLIESTDRWAFFGFSMAAFLPIIYFLCWLDSGSTGCTGLLTPTGAGSRKRMVFRRAMNLTVLSWIGYPVIWAVAEGSEVLNANGEAIAYTILDIISKSFFGWIIVFSEWGEYLDAIKGNALVPGNGGSSML